MKKWILHILLFAGIFGMLTTSCSQEADDPTADTGSEKLQVFFTLNLGEEGIASRTTWEGYDPESGNKGEVGTDAENMVNDIQVLLFANDDNGTFLGEVSITAFYPTDGDSHLYRFYGELPNLPSGYSIMDANKYLNCKLMVLANCSVDPNDIGTDETMYDVLEEATFNFDGTPDEIPMWGVLQVTPTDAIQMREGGFPNPLPDIYLLRAMAKVEVIMQDTEHQITSIAINRYNETGNLVPTGYDEAADTRAMDREGVFRATTSINMGTSLFIANESTTTDGYKCYTIYVPEYDNTGADVIPSSIDIQLDGNTKTYTVLYGANGKSTDYNIVRNHLYRFNITQVKTGEALELELIVNPWNVDEEKIAFTDQVTVSEKMIWDDTNQNLTTHTEDASILIVNGCVDASTAAEVNFKIDTPTGATWYASFEGDKEAFAFLNEEGNEVSSVTGEVGVEATLRIVTTEEHVSEMKSVSLIIVVRTMDGRTIMVSKDLMPDTDEMEGKEYYQLRQNLTVV